MASERLELVRSIVASWERGDFSGSDWADSNIEWVIADGVELDHATGLTGMAQGWRDFVSLWDDYRIQAQEYRELDDERVLVRYRRSGRGKTSGMDLEQLRADGATVFCVRAGKVMSMVSYTDPDRSLAELGLVPDAGGD
jgi:ketosteroid isomerase-like protein